jgi:ABC-type nitrate/sulfonate/bicarbonate transport system substrate-binding protein
MLWAHRIGLARGAVALASVVLGVVISPIARADTLRVAKPAAEAFSFVPADVGVRAGIFKKYGVDLDVTSFAGSARQQQAMVADAIDIALGAGTDFPFIIKGSPITAIAAMAGAPRLLTLVVNPDGPVRTLADLKGRKIGVSTAGSLTYWLVEELSRQQGFGPGGIEAAPMGATPPQIAALKRKEIDGFVTDVATALALEKSGDGKILVRFGDLVKDFHIHVIFATNKLIAERPETVRNFLKAWFETIAWMRGHKAETVDIAKDVMGKDADIVARNYDELMPMFSADGRFDAKALKTISRSFVDLKILAEEPDLTKYYTEAYLPAQ